MGKTFLYIYAKKGYIEAGRRDIDGGIFKD
jgi:hypothetical protein